VPVLVAALLWAHAAGGLASLEGRHPDEAELKAEFIERFTRFIEWPRDDAQPPDAPFIIGIVGTTPVAHQLERVARDRPFHGRTARVQQIRKLEAVQRCNLVFIAGTEDGRLAEILAMTDRRPILTVSDSPGFAERGVLINLYRQDSYLRFEINHGEVDRSGLRVAAQLLRLARLVGSEMPGDREGTSARPGPSRPGQPGEPEPPERRLVAETGSVPEALASADLPIQV
jgi:hypothetical protein